MHDVAMRRRIAALVMAALLAIFGAALTTAYFAADAQARATDSARSDRPDLS
jgi:hypothetical protein